MKTDKDIELDLVRKQRSLIDEFWNNEESTLQILHKIEANNKKIRKSKQHMIKIRKEIKILKHKVRKEIGTMVKLDEELSQEFDEINGIEYVNKTKLGIEALDKLL